MDKNAKKAIDFFKDVGSSINVYEGANVGMALIADALNNIAEALKPEVVIEEKKETPINEDSHKKELVKAMRGLLCGLNDKKEFPEGHPGAGAYLNIVVIPEAIEVLEKYGDLYGDAKEYTTPLKDKAKGAVKEMVKGFKADHSYGEYQEETIQLFLDWVNDSL